MNIVLWVLQILLAAVFVLAGGAKLIVPIKKLRDEDEYTRLFRRDWALRLLGVPEIAGALGLILPGVTGIATVLTPIAAVGLAVMMLLGFFANVAVRAGKWQYYALSPALCLISALVAWGRFTAWPL